MDAVFDTLSMNMFWMFAGVASASEPMAATK